MADPMQQATLERFLARALRENTKTLADIKALALEAFARQSDGTTVVEVTFEGGATRLAVNCPPSVLLAACENVIDSADPANPLAGVSGSTRYADLSGGRIET